MVGRPNLVYQQTGRFIHVADHRRHLAIVPEIPHSEPARRSVRDDAGASIGGDVGKRAVAKIVVENARLFVVAAKMLLVDLGIDVPIHQQQIRPPIVIEVEKHRSPSQIFGVEAKPSRGSHIVECSIAVVAIEGRSIVGKVRLENVKAPITVVVADRRSHARLLAPVFIERRARSYTDVGESAVAIIAIENARGAVASDINIGPAIVVEVESRNAERVVAVGLVDVRFLGNVLESVVAAIAVQDVLRPRESARPAHHRHTLPHARWPISESRRRGKIKVHVVRDHQIEMAVAIIINPRASRTPGLPRARHTRFFRDLGEHAVLVVVQAVLPVVSDVKIFPPVVVVIADANPLPPARRAQTSLDRDIGKRPVMIVAIEMVGRSFPLGKTLESRAVDDEDVGPSVVVVIEDGNPGARRFNDVLLRILAAKHVHHRQSGFLGDIREIGDGVPGRSGLALSGDEPAQRDQDQQNSPRKPVRMKTKIPRQTCNPTCMVWPRARRGQDSQFPRRPFKEAVAGAGIVTFVKAVLTSDFAGTFLISRTATKIRALAALLVLGTLAGLALAQKAPDKSAIDNLYKQGVRSLQAGDLDAARADFEKVVRLAPNAPEGHNSLGWVLMSTGKIDDAITQFRTALRLNADFLQAHINLAHALSAKGDNDAAVKEARVAVKLAPRDAEAHRSLGRALSLLRDLNDAIAEFRKASQLDPQRPDLHDELGALLVQNSQLEDASTEFAEALRLQPRSAAAKFHLGVLRWKQRSLDEAGQLLQSAVELAPDNAEAHYYLARVRADKGDSEGAVQEWMAAVKLRPDFTEAETQLGLALQRKGDAVGAVSAFRQVIKTQPDDANAHNNLGLALIQSGDAPGAVPEFEAALRLKPEDRDYRGNLGIAYLQRADFDAAIREFRAALQGAPDDVTLHYNLGLALKLKDDLPAAIVELQKAAQLDPEQADVHYTLGVIFWQQGDFARAADELRAAIKARPGYAEAHYTLGTVLKQQGKLQEAADALREAIRLQPDFAGAHTTLGGVLRQLGNTEGAAAESKLGAEMAKSVNALQAATFSTNSGRRLLNAGDLDGAISQFRSATGQLASYAPAHFYLAQALRRKGLSDEAERELRKASELDPHFKSVSE